MPDGKPRRPVPCGDAGAVAPHVEGCASEQRRRELEEELHLLDQAIGRIRQQMLLLRGLERTPERQARLDELARRYEELGARFTSTYRAWNALD